jgi:hypothetical protein
MLFEPDLFLFGDSFALGGAVRVSFARFLLDFSREILVHIADNVIHC